MNDARKTKFVFSLDGTVTAREPLPLIAMHFGIAKEIGRLTQKTVQGDIPFVESFIQRVHILSALPVDGIDALLADVPLYAHVIDFIVAHKDCCAIATGNLRCWISLLASRVDCACFCSDAIVENNRVVKLTNILRKELVVERYQQEGYRVVFAGEGNNDMEAMRIADVAIASGLTHQPSQSVLTIADYFSL